MIFKRLKQWCYSLHCYVIVDPTDNSVTLSKALFQHIRSNAQEGEEARVFVFRVAHMGYFGFMTNPGIEQPAQMCDIQYNEKHHCIGFETLCPSVGSILYDYGLSATRRVKLSVSVCHTQQGKIYYKLNKPHAKYIRKHQKS